MDILVGFANRRLGDFARSISQLCLSDPKGRARATRRYRWKSLLVCLGSVTVFVPLFVWLGRPAPAGPWREPFATDLLSSWVVFTLPVGLTLVALRLRGEFIGSLLLRGPHRRCCRLIGWADVYVQVLPVLLSVAIYWFALAPGVRCNSRAFRGRWIMVMLYSMVLGAGMLVSRDFWRLVLREGRAVSGPIALWLVPGGSYIAATTLPSICLYAYTHILIP